MRSSQVTAAPTPLFRRKICVVGCSTAGKTSLVKSITSNVPQLVHVDDRTIGIDQFSHRFKESGTSTDQDKIHEITFWDFAGQDAYQVAHSLFFSPRTLFLVCVDLDAFANAYMQAVIRADGDFQETKLVDEFMEHSVMRWVRMIVARQPDAEFVFVATKEDALAENKGTKTFLKDHLKAKLAEVATTVHKMKTKNADDEGPTAEGSISAEMTVPGVMHQEPSVVFVSCTSQESTDAARTEIENLVIQSDYSFVMPDTYSEVLNEIVRIREVAMAQGVSTRITQAFAPMNSLPATLKIEPELCRIILQTLHDLGDVLWFEDLGVELFKNTVILDPLLLIDFIRQVINHTHMGVTMSHADLKSKPFWIGLSSETQLKAMKQVLHKFRLVYPDAEDRVMEWDSDLIVPGWWQTKTPASRLFLGDILRINASKSCEGETVRVDWEYHFKFGLPSALFDQVVVASVSPDITFDAGPDWILYEEKEITACRIMVGRDPKSLHQIIHVEAVVTAAATDYQADELWWTFKQLFGALLKVLGENPGLPMSSFACDDRGGKINLKRLVHSRLKPSSKRWLPPPETWNQFKRLMTPEEVVDRGAASTQAYIEGLKTSRETVLRRKICLVGPSCAGKTSLIKSITAKRPQLEHLDERTIGIDHFPLRFEESIIGLKKARAREVTVHEVTFWDFAGQDAYQVAHSLFFSPRTLFLVCVDLEAFAIAYMQAVIFANEDVQEAALLDEFVERSVMRWVRMIVARQPDAEFVFIATKDDALDDNKVTELLLKKNLMAKLKQVETTVEQVRDRLEKGKWLADDNFIFKSQIAAGEDTPEPTVVWASCTSPASVKAARLQIEELIVKSNGSFQMPDTYSLALQAIVQIRKEADKHDTATRIHQVFAAVDTLPAKLNIEPELCHIIMRTLHDLGDVLWYEDLGVALYQNTVILDPLFLIDFIRQVINHKHKGVMISHADLIAKQCWMGLSNEEHMEAMKQVLHKFCLVYPDDEDGVMHWYSDLIVPAFWQTKARAAWLFGGDILRINKTRSCEGERVRVHWEYHFQFGLPSPLFDQLVVASVSPYFKFDAGPDWIVYEKKEIAACRIMVGIDPESLLPTIHVEAVVATAANQEQTDELWGSFQQLCEAFLGALREYPGLTGVSSFSCDGDGDGNRTSLTRLMQSPKYIARKWMPPEATWLWYKQLVTKSA